MENLLIKNAFVVSPENGINEELDILIENGIIKKLGKNIDCDCKIIDAQGMYALPGLVDMHVHLRDPGQTQKEDIFSGCKAAAAGGAVFGDFMFSLDSKGNCSVYSRSWSVLSAVSSCM